ncbi:MAG: PilZ domain-containing protein [Treponema bryantii]|nr:PilZ domain-containing protein [Treponema bryantii]
MGISTSLQISRYYDFFRDKEIVFTKANLQLLKIDPRQIYLKCGGSQWPCIINSSSLQSAKIIIGKNSGAFTQLEKNPKLPVSLRFCFFSQDNAPIYFFVNCLVDQIQDYTHTNELALITLNFSQRPPDDLILRIGEVLEANENFVNRREDRINITKDSIRSLGIEKEEGIAFIENVPRRCIMKDLSFNGAKILCVGIPKFLINKAIGLRINFVDTNEIVVVYGTIVRSDFMEGRKDIAVVHIKFDSDKVPMPYKIHINNYITMFHKSMLGNNKSANIDNTQNTQYGNVQENNNQNKGE